MNYIFTHPRMGHHATNTAESERRHGIPYVAYDIWQMHVSNQTQCRILVQILIIMRDKNVTEICSSSSHAKQTQTELYISALGSHPVQILI